MRENYRLLNILITRTQVFNGKSYLYSFDQISFNIRQSLNINDFIILKTRCTNGSLYVLRYGQRHISMSTIYSIVIQKSRSDKTISEVFPFQNTFRYLIKLVLAYLARQRFKSKTPGPL